jgi:YD repeat-containing protein
MTYDALNRVTVVNELGWATLTFQYDHAGNQIGKADTATGEVWTYSYDDKNELIQVVDTSTGGTVTSTYEYDAFGNRIEQSVATSSTTTVTKYAQDGRDPALKGSTGNSNWNSWAHLTSGGSMQTRYVWGDQVNELFARISSGGTRSPTMPMATSPTRPTPPGEEITSTPAWSSTAPRPSTTAGRGTMMRPPGAGSARTRWASMRGIRIFTGM